MTPAAKGLLSGLTLIDRGEIKRSRNKANDQPKTKCQKEGRNENCKRYQNPQTEHFKCKDRKPDLKLTTETVEPTKAISQKGIVFRFRRRLKKTGVLISCAMEVPGPGDGVRLQTADYRLHLGLNSTLVSLNSTQVSLFTVSYW